ncbi:MAG TPA: RsmD family RNA methyltransferase [Bacteriovoracaceae bacterium]|nr:RsmD family RNA methyltransferase [Bacteriovoracaceae bacterium]
MSLKILGGAARGFSLAAPKTSDTRPTSVLIRRKIFDWRQQLEGHRFIDLCAGSGAMGFEALSRGADEIFLVESGRQAFRAMKDNQERLEKAFADLNRINTFSMDAVKWLSQFMSFELAQDEQTILFMDPPYEDHKLYVTILDLLKAKDFKGEVWIEADRLVSKNFDLLNSYLDLTKTVEQGDHFVLIGKLV